MSWRRIAILVLAGLAGGLLVGLLEFAVSGHFYSAGIAYALTAVALRLYWQRRDSIDKGTGGDPP